MQKYLLHAINTHLKVMQKPTETLCCFSLKLIDIIIDDDKSRAEKESIDLLVSILNNIITSIIETIDRIEKEAINTTKVLGPAMINTRNSLQSHLLKNESIESTIIVAKYTNAITEIAKAMKLFNFCGLSDVVKINDVSGNLIC